MKKKMKLLAVMIAITVLALIMTSFQTMNLLSKGVHSPIRVACVGDSITAVSGYPSDLQSLLGSKYLVRNFGVSGSTVLLNSWRPYMDQPEFQSAKEFQPNIVVIMLGTNDDLQELRQYNESFEGDYAKLIAEFRQLESKPQIWIVKPPPIFSNSSDLSSTYFTQTIIPQIEELARKQNLPIIDVYSAFENHTDYSLDGVHPNSQGATIIASEVYNAIALQRNSA
jgi:acyl-CoA thioesterase-1